MSDRPRLILALAGLAVALTSACFGGRLPARELYRLTVADSAPDPSLPLTVQASPPLDGSIAVSPYLTPGIYGEDGIVYRVGELQYGAYPSREWAIPLGEQLGVLTERVLQGKPLATGRALYDPPSRRAHPYVWRGVVRQFDEVVRGDTVFAAVELEAQLIRSADDSVLWSGSDLRERQVLRADMPGIVQALSALAHESVGALVGEARGMLVARARASSHRVVPPGQAGSR